MANIVLLSLLLISLGVALVAYRGGALVPLVLWRDDRLLFLAYCLVFISTWFVYFCSDRRSYSLEVRTLRRLLLARRALVHSSLIAAARTAVDERKCSASRRCHLAQAHPRQPPRLGAQTHPAARAAALR